VTVVGFEPTLTLDSAIQQCAGPPGLLYRTLILLVCQLARTFPIRAGRIDCMVALLLELNRFSQCFSLSSPTLYSFLPTQEEDSLLAV
jgi:hypothetical protein